MRPIDVLILLDESASINDEQWAESLDFIKAYAVALNGGSSSVRVGRVGLGADQVRISIVHWADDAQQSMGIPFRFSTSLNDFVGHLGRLSRQYRGLGCPVMAMKWSAHYAICTSDVTNANFDRCNGTMSEGALVHATQSASNPPVIQNPETGVIGIAPDTGTVAGTAGTTTISKALLRRRRLELKTAAAIATAQYPVLVPSECCKTCFEGQACGDSCINANYTCKATTGCACDAIPTAGKLFMAGQYVLAKQGLAAVRPPPITHTNGHTSCGCQSLAKPTECIYMMTNLTALAGERKTCKAYCLSRPDSNTECGYTYGEYSAELGFRSNANGGATVVVVATDGNPALTSECATTDAARTSSLKHFKGTVDRLIPVGIGQYVSVGTLETLSWGMPPSMTYITTSFGTLASALDILATMSCPTQAPTAPPTKLPTNSPTTAKPTAVPTAQAGCTADEWNACDKTNGLCLCGDAKCSTKVCSCKKGFGCSGALCSICTVPPTRVPTISPTAQPSKVPTDAPSEAPTGIPTARPTYAPTPAPSKVPTQSPTVQPSASPTKSPTVVPTRSPTFSNSCTQAQLDTCDGTNGGTCSADGSGGFQCACPDGWGCADSACATCTKAPTNAPTHAPSTTPSRAPSAVSRTPTTKPTKLPTTAPSEAPSPEPTAKPTLEPSFSPTGKPSPNPTAEPSMSPTFPFGCSDDEKADCDSAVGICYCSDAVCSAKKCGCPTGWGCSDAACGTCTAAPSHAPTMEPSASPTMDPTALPTY